MNNVTPIDGTVCECPMCADEMLVALMNREQREIIANALMDSILLNHPMWSDEEADAELRHDAFHYMTDSYALLISVDKDLAQRIAPDFPGLHEATFGE